MPLIFSYGTLQQEQVQLSNFGRLLKGQADELIGFEQALVRIEDPDLAVEAGMTHHANIRFSGRDDSGVRGMSFEITDAELLAADRYEARANYKRIAVTLASGNEAWVYVHSDGSECAPTEAPM